MNNVCEITIGQVIDFASNQNAQTLEPLIDYLIEIYMCKQTWIGVGQVVYYKDVLKLDEGVSKTPVLKTKEIPPPPAPPPTRKIKNGWGW